MGMMKNYLLKLLEQCSEEKFGQDAVEWAVGSGLVRLTYDLDSDVRESMSRYDEIIEAYRHSQTNANAPAAKSHAPMQRAAPRRRKQAAAATGSRREKRAA